jgi:antitoxin MazE
METEIIKIGNSRGLLLSKTILEKYEINDKVEIILEMGQIILKPISSPRKNWEKAFEKIQQDSKEEILLDDVFNDETFEEWN